MAKKTFNQKKDLENQPLIPHKDIREGKNHNINFNKSTKRFDLIESESGRTIYSHVSPAAVINQANREFEESFEE